MKTDARQRPAPRSPRQARAVEKVGLILEAAMRLLDRSGHEGLTTNAVAEAAGVSVGTLYQYFPNKEAILDALAAREVKGLGERAAAAVQSAEPLAPEERIVRIVRAVMAGYGGRGKVHRLVMEHSLGRGSRKMAPVVARLIALLTTGARAGAAPMSRADAFVATYAFVGVMRAAIAAEGDDPPPAEIEASLARLLTGFAHVT